MDSLTLVRKLKAHGADVNARVTRRPNVGVTALNFIGATPFFMAARGGDTELMRLLVELGADPLLPNEDGTTPLMVAAGVGTHSPGEDAGTPVEALEAVKLAIELGGDVNTVDKNGNTAMHGAAFKQLPDVVALLAAKGADVSIWNSKNVSGWTPLRIAVGVHRGMNLRFHVPTADALRDAHDPAPTCRQRSNPKPSSAERRRRSRFCEWAIGIDGQSPSVARSPATGIDASSRLPHVSLRTSRRSRWSASASLPRQR